jgi:hypothetical protein
VRLRLRHPEQHGRIDRQWMHRRLPACEFFAQGDWVAVIDNFVAVPFGVDERNASTLRPHFRAAKAGQCVFAVPLRPYRTGPWHGPCVVAAQATGQGLPQGSGPPRCWTGASAIPTKPR